MFLSVCVLVENIEKSGLFLFVISFKIDSFSLLYISNQHINWHFPFLQFCLFDALFLHYHWSLLFLDTVIYQTFPSLASTTIPLIEIQIGQDVCIVTVDIHVSSALLLEGPQAKEAN